MSNREDIYFIEEQFLQFPDFDCGDGWILDFGGGGEGVIGQVKGSRVVAIDSRKSELQEALERDCKALLVEMDGANLKFLDNSFSTVTAFFSIMYIVKEREKIFHEIFRVLKKGGKFLIWDANLEMPKGINKKIMAFHLKIKLPSGKLVETGYGTPIIPQKMENIIEIAKNTGFEILTSHSSNILYYLELRKP